MATAPVLVDDIDRLVHLVVSGGHQRGVMPYLLARGARREIAHAREGLALIAHIRLGGAKRVARDQ